MKCVFTIWMLGTLLFCFSSIGLAIEIQGEVVGTTGLDVTVKTVGENSPVPGDLMEISFSIPGGDSLSIGIWKVTSVSGTHVSAYVVENTGTPSKGQQAVIISNNPVPIRSVRESQASKPFENNEQRVYTAPTGGSYLTPEAQEIVNLLRSSDSVNKRNGAKRAHRYFANDAGVIAVVAEELDKGYAEKPRDRHHVDAMAWLCNVLGASKDVKYKDLLILVASKCPSKKVRKLAKKNLRLLR